MRRGPRDPRDPRIDPRVGDEHRGRTVDLVKYQYQYDARLYPNPTWVFSVRYQTAGAKRARWVSIQAWRRWAGVSVGRTR